MKAQNQAGKKMEYILLKKKKKLKVGKRKERKKGEKEGKALQKLSII